MAMRLIHSLVVPCPVTVKLGAPARVVSSARRSRVGEWRGVSSGARPLVFAKAKQRGESVGEQEEDRARIEDHHQQLVSTLEFTRF